MAIGFSLFLIAVGAILAFAVNYTVTGIDISIVGTILMVIGVLGLLLSLLFWASFSPFADRSPFRRRFVTVASVPAERTAVVREEVRRD